MSSAQENACSDCATLRKENQKLRQQVESLEKSALRNQVGEVSEGHDRLRFIANETKNFRPVIPCDENFLPDYSQGGCIGAPLKYTRVDGNIWEAWIRHFWEYYGPDGLYAWVRDEKISPHIPQLCPPDAQIQSLWAGRRARVGFSNETFPPISLSRHGNDVLPAMLQLLFIASPDDLMALASQKGPAWELNSTHPAVMLCDDYSRRRKGQMKLKPRWIALTQNSRFQGMFGTLINRLDVSCVVQPYVTTELWWAVVEERAPTWQKLFNKSFGPRDLPPFGLASNLNAHSIQTFVAGNTAPTYLTIAISHSCAQDLYAFPDGGFVVPMRCQDGSGVLFRVRWVGGLYNTIIGQRVIFDWGDGSGAVGMSNSGDWDTHPPSRYSREDLARLVMPHTSYQALFRRF